MGYFGTRPGRGLKRGVSFARQASARAPEREHPLASEWEKDGANPRGTRSVPREPRSASRAPQSRDFPPLNGAFFFPQFSTKSAFQWKTRWLVESGKGRVYWVTKLRVRELNKLARSRSALYPFCRALCALSRTFSALIYIRYGPLRDRVTPCFAHFVTARTSPVGLFQDGNSRMLECAGVILLRKWSVILRLGHQFCVRLHWGTAFCYLRSLMFEIDVKYLWIINLKINIIFLFVSLIYSSLLQLKFMAFFNVKVVN